MCNAGVGHWMVAPCAASVLLGLAVAEEEVAEASVVSQQWQVCMHHVFY